MCDAWMDFETFAADVGEPSAGMSLDRIDNNGGYEPANCRWVTQRTQMRNMSRNRLIAYDGRTLCVAEWADVFGMREHTMHSRLDRGWSMDRIASQPLGRRVRGRATP